MAALEIEPPKPTMVGSYRIVSRLGSGGMGEVWIGEHELLGRRAALKVLLPRFSQQTEVVNRFFAEARAAAKITDPGIVHIYDFGWQDGDAYIAMELLEGESLANRLIRRAVPLEAALRLIHQLALTMSVVHAAGIVHRDLKPDNLFVVADPAVPGGERIKILDFGIAKLFGDDLAGASSTQSGMILGTPMYMSPEQCRGAGGVDHRTDIYAVGCLLYVLICGRPPFVNDTAGDMIASHLREQPEPPSTHVGVSQELDELVLRCLAKSVDERFARMADVVAALAAVQDPSTTTPTPTSPRSVPRITPPAHSAQHAAVGTLPTIAAERRRSRTWIALVAVAVLAIAATWFAVRRSRGERAPSAARSELSLPGELTDARSALAASADAAANVDAAPPDAEPPPDAPTSPADARRRAPRDASTGLGSAYLNP